MINHFKRNEVRALSALTLLLVLGAAIAPETLRPMALVGLLPFAGILAVAALGQHLVIQQRGMDVSVAGTFSLAAVIVTALADGSDSMPLAFGLVILALLVGGLIGLANGLTVSRLGVPPLVVTIAVNSIAFGIVLAVSRNTPKTVAAPIGDFAATRVFGVPAIFLLALAIVLVVAFVLGRMAIGRRFIVAGLSPAVGQALGFRVEGFQVGAYVTAGMLFAAAGVLFAGLSNVPTLFSGNDYMLATVAAYVVGGNALMGERGSVLATGIGAFFLTYLGQLVVSLGLDTSVQYLIQAMIVLLGVSLPSLIQQRKTA